MSKAVKPGSSRLPRPSRFNFTEAGPTAVEYSLILAFIAAALIAALSLVGPVALTGFHAAFSDF
jgi:Flp pilus assembly pilin Flp